mmetsp:Transcript_1651/g.1583  ORF Transcript_1651/g.1583 Transcript_1651/m.1583 type:complete len:206 (+) Transcript_1651:460-1077(+)
MFLLLFVYNPRDAFFLASSMAMALARLSSLAWVFNPMIPPPHLRVRSLLLLYFSNARFLRRSSCAASALSTPVIATTAAVFWCTRAPRRALSLTIMKGTSIFLQSAGSHKTNSIGSTSQAIIIICAFFSSTREVTCLSPNLTWFTARAGAVPPEAAAAAVSLTRCFLAAAVSGRYLFNKVKTVIASFLERVLVNWFTAGGTLRRW